MSTAFDLSSQIDAAPDDHARFQLLAEAIRALAEQAPQPEDIARGADVRESELRLQKEIAVVHKEMREGELRLQGQIEEGRRGTEVVRKEMREGELRLQEQIREVELRLQGQIREVELRLQGQIEEVRKEIREVELRLQQEIDQVRVDLKATEVNLRTAIHRQTVWIIGAIGAVTGLIRLLDWLLA
ncbi:hypothetical protein [uncultured Thiohalocapsa sp.]|uniref:hypothetical protein n=1 Tax=uncultured Thiohalocapsa sp. TaxID=768990 RepID=UPI0025D8B072|nr:hypothetical protein [uncultured Thiohalocapsa sp.]